MSQTLFASNASPSLPLLDANFNDVYGLANLFTTPTYVGTGTKFTVDASGNLGLSVAPTSNYRLDVSGTVRSTGGEATSGFGFRVLNSTGNGGGHLTANVGSAAGITISADGGNMILSAGGSERARFDAASGYFLVGTTSATTPNPGTIVAPGIISLGNNAGTSGYTYAYFQRSASIIGSITQSGTTAVLYNTTSDRRLKRDIVDAPEAGAIIDSIRVRSFVWRAASETVTHGFIAQELAQVAPQAVKIGDDGDEVLDQWGVDPGKLVPLLVKELQSVRARLAVLEAK